MNQPSTNTIVTLLKYNTTKKHITNTIQIKPKHITLKHNIYIYIQMDSITIKHNMPTIILQTT